MNDSNEKAPAKHAVPEGTVSAATRCTCAHACLDDDICMGSRLCRVKSRISDKLFVVTKDHYAHCDYCVRFGDENFCSCPVRLAIHQAHGV